MGNLTIRNLDDTVIDKKCRAFDRGALVARDQPESFIKNRIARRDISGWRGLASATGGCEQKGRDRAERECPGEV